MTGAPTGRHALIDLAMEQTGLWRGVSHADPPFSVTLPSSSTTNM